MGSFVRPDGRRIRVHSAFEDDAILAIDKPAGLLTVPDRYDASLPHVATIVRRESLWVVHRLDRDTSGILLLARTAESHAHLNEQFQKNSVEKSYVALVVGSPVDATFSIDEPLRVGAGPGHRTVVNGQGKPSQTQIEVVERYRGYSLIKATPSSGRTHQIRVHLSYAGFPVVADALYGDGRPLLLSTIKARYNGREEEEKPLIARQALHAETLTFVHPTSHVETEVSAPHPKDLRASINQLRKWARV